MARYVQRPVEVEAIQWRGEHGNLDELFALTGRIKRDGLPDGQIGIYSPLHPSAGYRIAKIGDWVVKTLDGDVHPMRDEEFNSVYVLADILGL